MEQLHQEQCQGKTSATTTTTTTTFTVRCFTTEIGVIRGGRDPREPPWIIPTTVFLDHQQEVGEEGAPTILYLDHLQTFTIPQRIPWAEAGAGLLMAQETSIPRSIPFTGLQVRGG